MFFDPRKAEKFSKLAKNGVDAVKGTVLATPRGLSAALRSMLVAQHNVSATPDTHGNSRGA